MWRRALLLTFACAPRGLGSSSHGEAKPLIGSLRAQPVMGQSHTYPQGSAPSSPSLPCPVCPSVNSILPPGTRHHFHRWAHTVSLLFEQTTAGWGACAALGSPCLQRASTCSSAVSSCLPLYFLPSHSKEKKCYPNTPSYEKITPDENQVMMNRSLWIKAYSVLEASLTGYKIVLFSGLPLTHRIPEGIHWLHSIKERKVLSVGLCFSYSYLGKNQEATIGKTILHLGKSFAREEGGHTVGKISMRSKKLVWQSG